jgi:preprotein translocase subunit SecF
MSVFRNLYRGETSIDFRPIWRISVPLSSAIAVISIVLLVFVGLNLSIDFEGGGVWEVPVDDSVDVSDARSAASSLTDARVQLIEAPEGSFIRVQSDDADPTVSAEIVAGLAELGGVSADEVSVATVGPTWGSQITNQALRALVLFFVAVALYLAWRLEWRMAVGALLAVVHDLAITTGFYSLFAFEVSPATIIALLTILGYSLYDTVVVYDKVLENQDSPLADDLTPAGLVNHSMNQVLMRSINTTITTVLPVLSMLIIGGVFLGGASLRDFALALFIGLILGTYSSIFVAAPVLVRLKEREPETDAYRKRLRRAGDGPLPAATAAAAAEDGAEEPGAALVGSGVIEPRPRKKRRR